MTNNSFKKKAVRARMEITGEPYSVANRELSEVTQKTLTLPWDAISAPLRHWKTGNVYMVLSSAGNGRDAFAMNVAAETLRSGMSLTYFTLTLTSPEVAERIEPLLQGSDETQTAKLMKSRLSIFPKSQTQDLLVEEFDELDVADSADVLIIDYAQFLMDWRSPTLKNALVQNLQKFAVRKNMIVVLLLQTPDSETPISVQADKEVVSNTEPKADTASTTSLDINGAAAVFHVQTADDIMRVSAYMQGGGVKTILAMDSVTGKLNDC